MTTTLLPYHKKLAIRRSLDRAERARQAFERGKTGGRTHKDLLALANFYGEGRCSAERAGPVDVRVYNIAMPPTASGSSITFSVAWRCLRCGGKEFLVPDPGVEDDDYICACRSCGPIGRWGDQMAFAKWLALDEWHHGEPHKFARPPATGTSR